ncbi:unnamed protein product [Didymodactylos carnosus]|uniref:Uncharacterized protein n=1 Tax=Didymodactylos carnosus TaxID=1234261 RepID=A0A815S8U7_9BILA|nr:unnamed protein product [Didymodactylos carnosus]CAF1484949.1 unnamed protein product [Didymodactylos carnosus]CAF3734261.1 unnamed protein product [Didymodactylos carnosus]CAF4349225.1 unnamed protein product [Didymodactylos carnosus]
MNNKSIQLKYQGINYQETNLSVSIKQSSVKCYGAIDDSSDRQVYCPDGVEHGQLFAFKPIDEKTGRFTDPLGPKTSRAFELRRLYKHATLGDQDKCYGNMAGVYIIQYDNNAFSMAAFDPSGYIISTAANTRNKDGTFNRGTSVGTWECTKQYTASGQTNYFTYSANTLTHGQKIVSSTFYMQCDSSDETCSGAQQEFYYPPQYQLMPFHKGTLLTGNGVPVMFKASRLYKLPGIKSCHHKYSGEYAITFNRTDSSSQPVLTTGYALYPTAIVYAPVAFEDQSAPTGNILGVWDCNDAGKITVRRAIFDLVTKEQPKPLITPVIMKFQCGKQAGDKCITPPTIFYFYPLILPKNGTFTTTPMSRKEGIYSAVIVKY